MWPLLAADPALCRLIRLWNASIVSRFAKRLSSKSAELGAAAVLPSSGADDVCITGDGHFGTVARLATEMEKMIAVVHSIGTSRGEQMCLADPLVAAALMDSSERLGPFIKPAKARHGPHASGAVSALLAEPSKRPVTTAR